MGKKGKKKKEKKTGTPDVVKFKDTREFFLLKECVSIQESLPFVAVDPLTPMDFLKIARFLNMVGLLAENLGCQTTKEYRFNFHHKYLEPTPQYFPFGFDVDVIRQARTVQEKPGIRYNEEEHPFTEELRAASEQFLKFVDEHMTKIASEIEPRLKDDFSTGLKRFKAELKEILDVFDQLWMTYEKKYLKERHEILSRVFEPVDKLVTLEVMLSQAEERGDIEAKQTIENDFVKRVEAFTRKVCDDLGEGDFPAEVIPLAEGCLFYETKCSEEHLHVAKHVIKDYLELRLYVNKIPEVRLSPDYVKNPAFIRLLNTFHKSVLEAKDALEFAAEMPKLIHAKTTKWMTKKMIEPDVAYYNKTAHLHVQQQAPAGG
jgi:hypothetical protein